MNQGQGDVFIMALIIIVIIIISALVIGIQSKTIDTLKRGAIKSGAAEYVVNNSNGTTVFTWKKNLKNNKGE